MQIMGDWEDKFYKALTKEGIQIYKRLLQKITNNLIKEI